MSSQTATGNGKRVFVTGATGYIGLVVVELAVAEGYTVHGLSRNESGDKKLTALGATPVRGDLSSFHVLERESAAADAVLHLAYIHDFTLDYEQVLKADRDAVSALAEGLKGTGKPLIITAGTAIVDPDPAGGETDEDAPISKTFVLKDRIKSEQFALSLTDKGIIVVVLRLPPYVYGRGASFFVPQLLQLAAKAGESIYVDDGHLQTSDVHVDDAARLYLHAVTNAKSSGVFNGTGSTTVTLRQLAETIGAAVGVPVRSVSYEEAAKKWGDFLVAFVQFHNRASSAKATRVLGWHPKEVDMLTDITKGSYVELVKKLRAD